MGICPIDYTFRYSMFFCFVHSQPLKFLSNLPVLVADSCLMKICHRNHGPGRGCLQEAEKQRDRGPVRHLAKLLVMAMGRDSQ